MTKAPLQDSERVYPPPRLVVCTRMGDWIVWDKDRDPKPGDCPYDCDCTPVLYERKR